jgi:formyltetrahydrofolate deformylase
MIMVSKLDHCLNDLLYRQKMGDLDMTVTAVVSNHRDLAPIAEAYGLPFHHLPLDPANKAEQESALLALIEETGSELVILARHMQVLTSATCARLSGRAINIHHPSCPASRAPAPICKRMSAG